MVWRWLRRWGLRLYAGVMTLAAVVAVAGHFPPNGLSYYNEWSRMAVCDSVYGCMHELGHKRDQELGYPSRSEGWRQAVDDFRMSCESEAPVDEMRVFACDYIEIFPGVGAERLARDDLVERLYFGHGHWGGYSELYADLFAAAGGEPERLPEELRRYYFGEQ